MAVRQFVASNDDDIVRAVGALADMEFGVVAILIKRGSTGSWQTFFGTEDDGTYIAQLGGSNSDQLFVWNEPDADFATGPTWDSTSDWALILIRKPTGSNAPRFTLHYLGSTWAHANGSGSIADWDAAGAGGTVRSSWNGNDHVDGLVAVCAAWSNTLGPNGDWTANGSGDAAIEAAGLESAAANWLDASPDAMWLFNQESTATPVEDVTEGGADQTSISGTSVVTDDDPPGFDFSLGAEVPEVTAAIPLTLDIAAEAEADHAATASIPLSLDVAAATSADHQATAAIPLTLDVAPEAESPSGVTASIPLTLGVAPQTATGHEATAAIGLVLDVSPVATDPQAPLVNLDFIALAPAFRSRVATAPEFRDRVATSPEFAHGDAGEPEFTDREAGDPVFAHGQPTAPEFRERTALQPAFAHGDAGEPTT